MFWITLIALLLLGAVAAGPRLARGNADIKKVIDASKPFEGILGVVGVLWGLWAVINTLMHIGLLKHAPLNWIMALLIGVLMVALGFILAMGLLSKLLGNAPEVRDKLVAQHAKLAPRRESLGVTALICAALSLLFYLIN